MNEVEVVRLSENAGNLTCSTRETIGAKIKVVSDLLVKLKERMLQVETNESIC